ncbi:hypothetical protein QQ056_14685 [Oscillatoria laete-virens NRMC-F 0139]|nr:hypothetical protein [Oscillatoria laete-virens]MDL5054783.1 hypothetical protein [Oscillatoria laete-virens NRMC-F 0139]
MKTTLDISDELYRQAKILAASENRKIKDIVNEGLRLALGLPASAVASSPQRMTDAPVQIREGNELPVLTNEAMAELLDQAGESLP